MKAFPIPVVVGGQRSKAALEFRVSPPLSLYIHVPWCVRKCPYCDFNSHDLKAELPEQAYLDALIADLESALPLIWGRPIISIFFGGGTPSLLSAQGIEKLLTAIRMRVRLLPGAEITLEANPGALEQDRFAGFRSAGITRLSLGIQSFNPDHLASLGRIHDGQQAREAARLAASNFEQFNLDLMYGLPGQTLGQAMADLETALSFSPPHLSCYQLTLEPNTRFAAFPPVLPEPDLCADMQEAIEARLTQAGYQNYETSAFALPNKQCQHNLNYWLFGDYLGIGAGAHSKLTLHDRVLRQMRHKRPEAYLEAASRQHFVQEEHAVEPGELAFEFLMNALRLADGFPPGLLEARTCQPLLSILPQLQKAEQLGLLLREPEAIRPSPTGRRFLNRLLGEFLADRDPEG